MRLPRNGRPGGGGGGDLPQRLVAPQRRRRRVAVADAAPGGGPPVAPRPAAADERRRAQKIRSRRLPLPATAQSRHQSGVSQSQGVRYPNLQVKTLETPSILPWLRLDQCFPIWGVHYPTLKAKT